MKIQGKIEPVILPYCENSVWLEIGCMLLKKEDQVIIVYIKYQLLDSAFNTNLEGIISISYNQYLSCSNDILLLELLASQLGYILV